MFVIVGVPEPGGDVGWECSHVCMRELGPCSSVYTKEGTRLLLSEERLTVHGYQKNKQTRKWDWLGSQISC